jgi:hypothetical protein
MPHAAIEIDFKEAMSEDEGLHGGTGPNSGFRSGRA